MVYSVSIHRYMDVEQHKKFSWRARLRSFRYAGRGIGYLIAREHNAWIHLVVAVAVITAGICLQLSRIEWIAVIFAIGFVLAAEAINSAIERLSDRITLRSDPVIRDAKDLAAGGVLIAAITAAVVGLIVFIPRIYTLCI